LKKICALNIKRRILQKILVEEEVVEEEEEGCILEGRGKTFPRTKV